MQKLIELNNYPDILVSSTILNYEKPDYIYIPIEKNSEILVHKNMNVSVGTTIIKREKDILFSSISGVVTDIKKVMTIHGEVDAVEICNDFKDKNEGEYTKRNISKTKREIIDEIIKRFPNIDLNNKKNIVLNCIDDEPLVVTENFYLFLNSELFLEILDGLAKVYNLEQIIIAVKSVSSENISKLMNHLGMYPNITLTIIPNLYLIGNPKFLLQYLNLESNDTQVLSASKFYSMCCLLKRNRINPHKYITISGDGIEEPKVVNVRFGTKLKDILSLFKVNNETIIIANGLMKGSIIEIDNFIINDDLSSVLIMKKRELPKEDKCIHCGACIDICPVGINPLLLKNPKYKEIAKNKCLNCGLCSYICPVYINFREVIEGEYYD